MISLFCFVLFDIGYIQAACLCCSIRVYLPHCRNVINMFATAEGLLTQQDRLNSDGLQEVFATNLFGHFVLVHHKHTHTHIQSCLLTYSSINKLQDTDFNMRMCLTQKVSYKLCCCLCCS